MKRGQRRTARACRQRCRPAAALWRFDESARSRLRGRFRPCAACRQSRRVEERGRNAAPCGIVRRHIIRRIRGRPTMTHRFGYAHRCGAVRAVDAARRGVCGRRADPPPRNPPPSQPKKNNPRPRAPRRRRTITTTAPSRNSATAIAPPMRRYRPATNGRRSRRSRRAPDDMLDVANYLGYTARKLGDDEVLAATGTSALSPPIRRRAHLAVLRHVARRAGQHAQGPGLPRKDPA